MEKVICNSVGSVPHLCRHCGAAQSHWSTSCEPCPVNKAAHCVPVPESKPYYYHALRVTPEGGKTRYFRKVSRSETVPQILVDIGTVAFEAMRLFGAKLRVEQTGHLIPGHMVKAESEPTINDQSYVESDSPDYEDMIGIPDTSFWTDKSKRRK